MEEQPAAQVGKRQPGQDFSLFHYERFPKESANASRQMVTFEDWQRATLARFPPGSEGSGLCNQHYVGDQVMQPMHPLPVIHLVPWEPAWQQGLSTDPATDQAADTEPAHPRGSSGFQLSYDHAARRSMIHERVLPHPRPAARLQEDPPSPMINQGGYGPGFIPDYNRWTPRVQPFPHPATLPQDPAAFNTTRRAATNQGIPALQIGSGGFNVAQRAEWVWVKVDRPRPGLPHPTTQAHSNYTPR